jgi:hypothetical protein
MKLIINRLSLSLLVATALLFACKDDEMEFVTREEALGSLQSEDSLIVSTSPGQTVYAFSEFRFVLSNTITSWRKNGNVFYKFEYDSVDCLLNNKPALIGYEFSSDYHDGKFVEIKPVTGFAEPGKLKFTVYGSWYYTPNPDNYQQEDGWELLETLSEDVEYTVINRPVPQKVLQGFSDSEKNVSPYYVPRVQFNYLPGEELRLELTESAKILYFKYDLGYSLGQNGTSIDLTPEFTNDSTVVLNYKGELLPGQDYTLSVSAHWYRRYAGSNNWEDCGGQFNETVSQALHVTNGAGFSLDGEGVLFSYPLDRQFNFLKGEYDKGYIKLKDPEAQKWFENDPPLVTIKNVKTGAEAHETSVYNSAHDIVEYALSPGFFNNNEVYKITFSGAEDPVEVYSYYFKTSRYNTFTEKWEGDIKDAFGDKWRDIEINYLGESKSSHLEKIYTRCRDEILDFYESNLTDGLLPLIVGETHVPGEWEGAADWEIYSCPALEFDRRDMPEKKYGFPPLRAIYFLSSDTWAIKLSDNSLSGNIEYPGLPTFGSLAWEVQNLMRYDAEKAWDNAGDVPYAQRTSCQQAAASNYPDMPRIWYDFAYEGDTYPLTDFLYVLPGIDSVTTRIKDVQL